MPGEYSDIPSYHHAARWRYHTVTAVCTNENGDVNRADRFTWAHKLTANFLKHDIFEKVSGLLF